jgi:hypothetical protein
MDPLKQSTFGAVYVVFDDNRWLSASLQSLIAALPLVLKGFGEQ